MTEKLSELLERGTPQPPQLPRMAETVQKLGRRRQLRRGAGVSLAGAVAVGAALLTPSVIDAARNESSPDSIPAATQTEAEAPAVTDLSCPSDEMIEAPGGYLDTVPKGFDTRETAVEEWLKASTYVGSDYLNRPGFLGGSIVWERGWPHAEGRHAGEADHASV